MNLREFWRFHFLKALLGLVVIQLIIVAIIQNFNHKPVAVRDELSMIEGRELKIKPISNDSDKDDDTELSLKNFGKPANGNIAVSGNYLIYTPNKSFIGADSLWYTISDGKKESKQAYIAIKVNENLPPHANRDLATVYIGGKTYLNPLSNDNDGENDSIFIKEMGTPLYGKITWENNSLVYSATNVTASADSFQYTLSDGKSISQKATIYISIKSKNDLCYPWLTSDLGNVQIPGTLTCANGKMEVVASGDDIWNSQDGCYFVYQSFKGDGAIITRVESLDAKHEWAKAGVMIRESLDGGSKNVFLGMTLQHGASMQNRFEPFDGSNGVGSKEGTAVPYWLKLTRKGNIFMGLISADGINWEQIGSETINMSENVFFGLATTSHNNAETGKVLYSNLMIQ